MNDTNTRVPSPASRAPGPTARQRILGMLFPFFAGVATLLSFEYAASHETLWAMVNLAAATVMLATAWRQSAASSRVCSGGEG